MYARLLRAGVLAYPGPGVITLVPPLTITFEQMSAIADSLGAVLAGPRPPGAPAAGART